MPSPSPAIRPDSPSRKEIYRGKEYTVANDLLQTFSGGAGFERTSIGALDRPGSKDIKYSSTLGEMRAQEARIRGIWEQQKYNGFPAPEEAGVDWWKEEMQSLLKMNAYGDKLDLLAWKYNELNRLITGKKIDDLSTKVQGSLFGYADIITRLGEHKKNLPETQRNELENADIGHYNDMIEPVRDLIQSLTALYFLKAATGVSDEVKIQTLSQTLEFKASGNISEQLEYYNDVARQELTLGQFKLAKQAFESARAAVTQEVVDLLNVEEVKKSVNQGVQGAVALS